MLLIDQHHVTRFVFRIRGVFREVLTHGNAETDRICDVAERFTNSTEGGYLGVVEPLVRWSGSAGVDHKQAGGVRWRPV